MSLTTMTNILSWIRTNAGALMVVSASIGGLLGGVWTMGHAMGTLTAPTRVDTVDKDVQALRTQVETLKTNTDVDALTVRVGTLETALKETNTDVDALTVRVGMLETALKETNTDVDALTVQVGTLERALDETNTDVDPLRTHQVETPPASNEVIALRARVEALGESASATVNALRARVEALGDATMTTTRTVVARFQVETLGTALVSMTASDQADVLKTQVETLQEIIFCSIELTEDIRQYLNDVGAGRLTPAPLMSERCREFGERLRSL